MIKAIHFFHRRPDLTVEDFQEYWRTTHADLVRQVPGIQRCVQCNTVVGLRPARTSGLRWCGGDLIRFNGRSRLGFRDTGR
ncbi:MAG: EthD domain-containing protein [Desulfobacteraceae bacterium]|nr:EthD domain-containing protein [Desulfobacteraceae bacterium]